MFSRRVSVLAWMDKIQIISIFTIIIIIIIIIIFIFIIIVLIIINHFLIIFTSFCY